MGIRKRPLHARGGFFARACQLAGAGLLAAGAAVAVPAALAAAPAAATTPNFPTYTGTPADPVIQTTTDNSSCLSEIPAVKAHANVPDDFVGCATETVTKTDSWTGKPLAGAGITLYEAEVDLGSATFICGTPTYPLSNEVMTDSTGTATFTLPAFEHDSYAVCAVETTTPAGYKVVTPPPATVLLVADESWHNVSTDGGENWQPYCKTASQLLDDAKPAVAEQFTEQLCVSPASLSNAPDPVNIDISKYGTTNTGLDGATFTLQNSDGSAVTTGSQGSGAVVNGSPSCITAGGTSTTAATCSILNIMIAGTYRLAETSAPAGYNTVPPIPITVTLGTPPIQVNVTDTAIVVPTAATSGTAPPTAAVSGATTVHTGESFAGSAPYVAAALALGGSLLGLGMSKRRRARTRHLRA